MKFIEAVIVAAMLVVASGWSPAGATTAIYYSAPDNAYGWCAGYAESRAESCAQKNCKSHGGTECELALECEGGWGAVALAEDPATGIGMTCNMADAAGARSMAISTCAVAAKTLCWTDSAFNGRGDDLSAEDNQAFDTTWFAQSMLQIRGFDPGTADGKLDGQTRTALKEFERKLGREETGDLDDELFFRLVDAVGGTQHFASIIKRDVVDPRWDDISNRVYADAPAPLPVATISETFGKMKVERRLLALSTFISAMGRPCTLPARDAAPLPDPASGTWNVVCDEGSFTLMLSDTGPVIVTGGSKP